MVSVTVLFDGWPLVHQPNSPAALHLLALVARLPPEAEPILALPAAPPEWLPPDLSHHVLPVADRAGSHLAWEQRDLPRLARRLGADILHLTTAHPALFSRVPSAISPAGWPHPTASRSLVDRARTALGQGGLAGRAGLLWPADLPEPGRSARLFRLAPVVHPAFHAEGPGQAPPETMASLPETYILHHGPGGPDDYRRLLNTWSWSAGAIGSLYPLVVLGASGLAGERLRALLGEYHLKDSVQILPPLTPWQIPEVYRRASALFHPGPTPAWGGPVRHALACGLPIVSFETPQMDALVGPAGFLLPPGETRRLGAALITVVVETDVAESLSRQARERAGGWGSERFSQQLMDAYEALRKER